MSLSQSIKRLRLKKNLTQEQLAATLGVSAQAVSKWETTDTYPDGALLVALARALDVSLDELFENTSSSMADISKKIMLLMQKTDRKDRFHLVRDIGWQIERGLFGGLEEYGTEYNPEAIKKQKHASYILNDYGFTMISNGNEPFFAVFPEPENGFGDFLSGKEELMKIFSALSDRDTVEALLYLYRQKEKYIFESGVLVRNCGITEEKISAVMQNLKQLCIVDQSNCVVNGEKRTLYTSHPSHKLLAVFLMAREIGYKGAYTLQAHQRNTPFLK